MSDATASTAPHANTSFADKTRDSAAHAVEQTRETASHAAHATRDGARDAAQRTAEAIDSNPVVALVGGIALGAAIGALLPKTQVESEHLGPLGRKIADGATAAARAARDAGKEELSGLAPDKDAAKAKAASFLQTVTDAAKDSAKSTTSS